MVTDERGNETGFEQSECKTHHHLAILFPEKCKCFLPDILTKLSKGESENWDLFLIQAPVAGRFSINKTAKYSPYNMLFDRDFVHCQQITPAETTIVSIRVKTITDAHNT